MKLAMIFAASAVLSMSNFISATSLVDQGPDSLEKVYVNSLGDIIPFTVYPWGRYACKEKHAVGHKSGNGHRLDASGRLGKRQQSCPAGYTLACDAYSSNPCCPNNTPLCCTGSNVCCGTGQYCQGVSTCCNVGQIGCGEACCNYGETCCGDKCCGSGYTCDASNNTCNSPPNSSTISRSSTVPPTSYTYRAAPGPSTYVITTPNGTEAYPYHTQPPTSSSGSGGGGGGGGDGTGGGRNRTTIAAIAASLSALSLILAGVAAYFYKKKNDAEFALAAYSTDKPPVEKTPYAPPKEQEPYAN